MIIKRSPENIAYLNVGCGRHFSPEWNNLDLVQCPGVEEFDLRNPLPYPDQSIDVVYSSHVLEHLTPDAGRNFLREQFRVLKPGGICRVAVPDLERICRTYLHYLEEADRTPSDENLLSYDWSVLQLLDQLVRDKSGGQIGEALNRGHYQAEFVTSLYGDELTQYLQPQPQAPTPAHQENPVRAMARKAYRSIKPVAPHDPRQSGETHRWMYDRLSLRVALTEIGFANFSLKNHLESAIPHWSKYNLDLSADGTRARKPDSIFVEAQRL